MSSKTNSLTHSPDQVAPVHTMWDRLGIVGSLLCIVHCAVTPLALGFLSTAGLGFLGDEIFHKILAVMLLAVALLAFGPGFRKHGNLTVVSVGIVGLLLVVGASFLHVSFIPHDFEIGLTIAGSVLLVGAHTANWRLTNRHCECTEH